MTRKTLTTAVSIVGVAVVTAVGARFPAQAAPSAPTVTTVARAFSDTGAASQQFPMLNKIANKVIQKYQGSTCEQLWQERSAK